MAEINRLEYFAGLALQALVSKCAIGAGLEGEFARRAFEIARAMEAEATKHSPEDMTEREAERRSETFAHSLRSSS